MRGPLSKNMNIKLNEQSDSNRAKDYSKTV